MFCEAYFHASDRGWPCRRGYMNCSHPESLHAPSLCVCAPSLLANFGDSRDIPVTWFLSMSLPLKQVILKGHFKMLSPGEWIYILYQEIKGYQPSGATCSMEDLLTAITNGKRDHALKLYAYTSVNRI